MADDMLLADDTATTDDTTADTTTDAGKVVDGGKTADDTTTVTTTDDWRSRLAGEDEKLLGYLGRYQSEKAFVEAAKKDRDAARSKQALKLPDNPTEDELKAFRAEHGIPEAPEGYYEKLAEGLVVGDDDKPFVDKFMTEMHGAHASPAQINAALDAYYAIAEEQTAAETDFAKSVEQASVEDLRDEWGADYKRNLNVMNGYLGKQPESVQAIFRHGKVPELDADGEPTGRMIPIGYQAETIRWLVSQAMEENPVATVVPGAGANQASAIAEELASLKNEMGDRNSAYWKGPSAAQKQERYRVLVEAEQKLKGRP